jgi:dTMP kinase
MTEILPPHIYKPDNDNYKNGDKTGKLFAIEGIDGAGKTTIIRELAKRLQLEGLKVGTFKNHAGPTSPYWQSVKTTKEQLKDTDDELNFETDRTLQAIEFLTYCRSILPILINNYDVIFSDRYTLSKIVYGRVVHDIPNQAEKIIEIATDIPKPDATIFIDVDLKVAQDRIQTRNQEMDWKENPEYLKKAIHIYNRYVNSNSNIKKVNGNKTLTEVVNDILEINNTLP